MPVPAITATASDVHSYSQHVLRLHENCTVRLRAHSFVEMFQNSCPARFLIPVASDAGHFLLTELLLDTMKATAKESGVEGRIVIVSGALYNFTPKCGIQFDKLVNTNE